jgi:hypothetical protein
MNGQLELSFGNGRGSWRANGRSRRQGRANWWFERMRQIVDRAIDWPAATPPRPQQIWFPGSHRQVEMKG